MRVDRLACRAFEAVFQRRQTQHGGFLAWIARTMAAARPRCSVERRLLERAAIAWRAGRSGSDGGGTGGQCVVVQGV